MTPLDLAQTYIRRRWAPVPVPYRTKKPDLKAWQTLRISADDAPRYFNGKAQNVGVILGPASQGLTDVDLDCLEAVELARYLLPKTGAVFGRPSKPASHYLYITTLAETEAKAKIGFVDPVTKAMLLELRIGGENGAQTIMPGSTHENGEPIEWEKSGDPAEIAGGRLKDRVAALAVGCLLARNWPGDHARHEPALTLGGFLSRAGWSTGDIKHFVGAVATVARDPDVRDRERAAADASDAHKAGKKARGLKSLRDDFGQPVADRISEWLGYREAAGDGDDTAKERRSNDIVTEDGAAQQFAELYGDRLRFCHDAGAWFEWSGTVWRQNKTGVAFQWARELARRLSDSESAKVRYVTSKTSFAAGVERFARTDPAFAVTIDAWDRDPWLLGTPAGTVDLRTGGLRASNPADGITRSTAVAPADSSGLPNVVAVP